MFDYVHPADREAVMETFVDPVEDPEQVPTIEYPFRHADGSWRWLESHGSDCIERKELTGFVVNARSVMERKRHERELTPYETIVEASPDAIYALDSDFEFMIVNEEFEERTGLAREEIVGEPISLLVDKGVLDPEKLDDAAERARDVIRGEMDSVTFESTATLPEGDIETETGIGSLPAGDGRVGLVHIVQDVTDRPGA